jgi:hypothetical protein
MAATSAAARQFRSRAPGWNSAAPAALSREQTSNRQFTNMTVDNPKIAPSPGSNTEKDPDDWVFGDEPMTGAQESYLKTLTEQLGEAGEFSQSLTKAEASKRIDALKAKLEQRRQSQ